ncbi:coproporphyrinogen III oxidase [Verrucomicrobiaceae bacterium R5-34]|nr:coproporphyrinogen III oxidase [Verrucomicrobiaceae bacterium R5-34]
MKPIASAQQAYELVTGLQTSFVEGLTQCCQDAGTPVEFELVEWQRDGGKHGGGSRYGCADNAVFNRASVNVSHIHYEDDPSKKLASATAISTIIHPQNPQAPSVHIHISWTEMKGSGGYWRVMADLNPAIAKDEDTAAFRDAFEQSAPEQLEEGLAQGDKYFYIPALGRHRGVVHFYLEQYQTGNAEQDLEMATRFGYAVIQRYVELLGKRLNEGFSDADRETQLAYHSLYLLQVLTLDRGTTSGLLVHDQNDLGIMGSLPSRVNKPLLQSWVEKVPEVQKGLLQAIVDAIPNNGEVTNEARLDLAQAVRGFYQKHPEALQIQASGNVVPPTVANHR